MRSSSLSTLTLVLTLGLSAGAVGASQDGAAALDLRASQPASVELRRLEPFIGDWRLALEMIDDEGRVTAAYDAEWNFHYVLGGAAVQDALFLPPRDVALPDESARFAGSAFRVFDPGSNTWQSAWIDSSNGTIERWTGTFVDDRLVYSREVDGVLHRSIYRIADGRFHWEQSFSRDGGDTWIVDQVAIGERS